MLLMRRSSVCALDRNAVCTLVRQRWCVSDQNKDAANTLGVLDGSGQEQCHKML